MSRRAAVARTGRAAAAVLLSCLALPAAALPVCTSETITFRDFNGISGSSDSNVIGVGDQGTAYRYGGSGWSVMATPTFEDLNDVEVVDAGTAFAVGDDGAALQLVGGNWIDRSGFTGRDLYGIWAASATEAYAVGDRGEIWRWDGVGWSDESGAAGTDNRDIEDVWGDANFVYAMSERGELYIYDRAAGSWGPRDDLCRSGNNFSDLWGDGSGNIYMVRQRRVYLNDGSNCQIVENTGDDLNGIYGGGGRIVAGGDGGAVTENDGSGWQETDEASEDINDVWVSPAGSAWFGGNGGEVTSCVAVVPNLIADWPLDDCTLGFDGSAVIDSGPNGLNGTSVGGLNVEPNGQLCSAAEFNGSSSFVRVPDTAALDTTDGFSVAVWVRHDNTPLKNWEAILAKGDNSYRLHLNGGCGISDSLPGNTQYGFTLGLNGGCAGADLNSNVVPTPGVWYHVAATYDRSVMRIYINGTLVNSANYSAAINNSNFDLFIGENSQQRNRYWDGDIDELALWDNAITAQMINDHMNRTRPCVSCTSVEFEINHDNYGIHCVDEAVQVSVVDGLGGTPRLDYNGQVTLDTQTGNGSWSLVSGGGVLNDGAGDDGVATYQWVLGEDSAVFALTYPQGTATFDIDVYQASDPGIRDTDAEGTMTFSPSGFTVTATPLSNPPPGVIAPFATAQTAAVDFPVYLTAYGQTPTDPVCGVIESYTGSRNIGTWYDYVDPVNGGLAPQVDGVAAAPAEAGAGAQNVTFSNGQAIVSARYDDAGSIRLHFRDATVADPNLPDGIRGATAAFVSRPYTFVLSDIVNSDGDPNVPPSGPGDGVFTAAGTPFGATVTALNADGNPTPNFGRETSPETVGLVAGLVGPAGGDNPPVVASTGFGAFAGGQATGNDFSWAEVGIITLTPEVGDGDYLGAGNVIGTASANVGRFIPDHFTADLNSPAFETACSAGSFTWLGQSFGYATPPVVMLTARAADGTVTDNYAGAYFRISNASLANRTYTAASGTLDTAGLPGTATDPLITVAGGGQGTLTFDAGTGLSFVRGDPEVPFDAGISLAIDVVDADGVAALSNPVTFGASGGMLFDAGAEMRYGRVRLENAIGSELVDLNLPMRTEYFDTTGTGFIANAADSCSTDITLSFGGYTQNLADGDTCVIENASPGESGVACGTPGPAGLAYREPPLAGDFNLNLRAPGAGNDGSTTVTADVPDWLRFDWDAAAPGAENPAGTATFGIYRGEDRRIYTRELY